MANKEVETKVVQMRFDNQQFQKSINSTILSIKELDKSLKLKDSDKGLESVSESLDKINNETEELSKNTNNADKSLNKITISFKELLKIKVLSRIIDKITDSMFNMISSMTGINNVKAGWDAYNESLVTTGGILNQVARDGYGLEEVTEAMDKLRWYADETSYSFQTMSDGIRQFAIAGIDLNEATSAVQGITNLAGSAKVFDPYKVQSAMDAISKAMQTGYMDTMKWTTLTNTAGIVTKDFSDMLLKAAASQGTLIESAKGQYRTKKGGILVTADNIRDTMSKKWATDKVLTDVFKQYASATEVVKGFTLAVEDTDKEAFKNIMKTLPMVDKEFETFDELIEDITTSEGKYNDEIKAYAEGMNANNLTTRQAAILLEKLGYEFDKVSFKAFMSSQETTSFGQAISYVGTAIKTSWQGTFQSIFGDVEQSTALWSDISDELYGVFIAPFKALENQFKKWSVLEEGGANDFRASILNIAEALSIFAEEGGKIFVEIFGDDFTDILKTATLWIKNITEELKNNEEVSETVKNILRALMNILKSIIKIVSTLAKAFGKIIAAFGPAINTVSVILVDLSEIIADVVDILVDSGIIEYIGDVVVNVIKLLTLALKNLVRVFKGESVEEMGIEFADSAKNIFGSLKTIATSIVGLLGPTLKAASSIIETALTGLGKVIEWFGKKFEEGSITFANGVEIFIAAWALLKLIGIVRKIKAITNIFYAIADMLWVPWEWVAAKKLRAIGLMVLEIGIAIGLVAQAIKSISSINLLDLIKSLIAVGLVMATFIWLTIYLSKQKKLKKEKAGVQFLLIATSILLIAVAVNMLFKTLSTMTPGELVKSSVTVLTLFAAIMLIVVGYEALVSKIGKRKKLSNLSGTLIGISFVLLAMSVLFLTVKNLEWGDIAKGIVAMIGVFIMVGWLIVVLNEYGGKKVANTKIGRTLIAISIALLVMALILKILSTIELADIGKGVATITALLGIFVAFVFVMKYVMKNMGAKKIFEFRKIIGAIKSIAFGLLIMALAMLILTKVDWSSVGKAFAALGGVFAIIIALGLILSKFKKIQKGFKNTIKMLLGFAAGLLILSAALLILTFVSWPAIFKALTALGGVLGLMIGTLAIFKKIKVSLKQTISFVILVGVITAALLLLAAASVIFKIVKWEDIAKGLSMLVGVITIMIGTLLVFKKLMKGLSGYGAVLKMAATLGVFIAALFLISLTIDEYANIIIRIAKVSEEVGKENVIAGIGAFIGVIIAVIAMLLILTKKVASFKTIMKTIILIGVMIPLIFFMVKALKGLMGYDWKELGIAVLAMALVLAAMVAAVFVLSKISNSGWGNTLQTLVMLVAITAAIFVIGATLNMIAGYSWKQLWPAVLAMSIILGVMVAAVAILGALGESGVGFVGALLLLAIAAAVWILAQAFAAAGPYFEDFADMMVKIGTMIGDVIVKIINAIGDLITNIIDHLSAALHLANEDLITLLETLKGMSIADIDKLYLLAGGLMALGAAELVSGLGNLASTILNWLSGGSPIEKIIDDVSKLDDATLTRFKDFVKTLADLPIKMKNLNAELKPYKESMKELLNPVIDLAKQIDANQEAIDKVKALFMIAYGSIKDASSYEMAINYIQALKDLLNSDINIEPKITPMFDFTNFDSGLAYMRNGFAGMGTYYAAQRAQNDYSSAMQYRSGNVGNAAPDTIGYPGMSVNVVQNFTDSMMYSYRATRSTENMLESVLQGARNAISNSALGRVFKKK